MAALWDRNVRLMTCSQRQSLSFANKDGWHIAPACSRLLHGMLSSQRAGPLQSSTSKLYTVSATCRRTFRPPKAQERELRNMQCQQDTHAAWRRSCLRRSKQLAHGCNEGRARSLRLPQAMKSTRA
jgi:hypothetical protein